MTEDAKTGGQRKALPAIFALAVTGAGAIVLVLTNSRNTNVAPAAAATVLPAVQSVPAASRSNSARDDSRASEAQLVLAIERALVSNNPVPRDEAFNVALPALLDSNPQRVIELVMRQQGETRDLLRDEVIRQWIRRDRDAARIWMGSFEGEERSASAIAAMFTLAAIEPAQAVAVADEFGVGRDDGSLEHIVQ
ncbi:MAG: hypothetical protein ABUL69_01240, partial [Peristeroidobacter soli]